ncbi:MAG: urate hydroxylase PuuD [Acidiferrobacterales bacterium]|nr:urate hydroxylase PuuD [Acidiferrobacterales bacterium]
MTAFILNCLEFLIRWMHLIAGIAWIGSSFYFVWLDNSLEKPPADKANKGVLGDLWSIHGGGIYEIAKYKHAPPAMPEKLHWFKWEAYATWISGMLLMFVFYYFNAQLYLVDGNSWLSNPTYAIFTSLLFLIAGVGFYEILMRSFGLSRPRLFSILLILQIGVFSWLSCQLFGDRAAFLHVGAMLGSIMAGNVFLGIIPAQKYFVQCLKDGEKPALSKAIGAKTRSVNNNYLTLPVIFCMISNHYSFLYGHPFNWLVLVSIMGISAYARHFFNLKHNNIVKPSILIISLLSFFILMSITYATKGYSSVQRNQASIIESPSLNTQTPSAATSTLSIIDPKTQTITLVAKYCVECHSAEPTSTLFTAAPAGIMFDTYEQILLHKPTIITSVSTHYMPLANLNGMSEDERNRLIELLSD